MLALRNHQIECLDAINKHFDSDNTRALIKMFCGSGKSLVIYKTLIDYSGQLSVVVVPSINLITQFNNDYLIKYKNDTNHNYNTLTVCSKDEILSKHTEFTTDPDKIYSFLMAEYDYKIILITYQSLETLFNLIETNDLTIDLICFDEAHHVTAEGTQNLLFGEPNDDTDERYGFIDTNITQSLFFTATPINKNGICMFSSDNYITVKGIDYELQDSLSINELDMDEAHCGNMIFEYMHSDGVTHNVLNDFDIRIDLYTENNNVSIFEAISRTILETGNTRVLTFHNRSEIATDNTSVVSFYSTSNKTLFKKTFEHIRKTEFPHKEPYKQITFTGITAKTKNRISILNTFDNTKDDEIYVLGSCETIGEGVDTKNANMCVFIDPKSSYVKIIQNIGRICRKQAIRRNGTVLIPACVNVEKYKDCKDDATARDRVIREEMSKFGDFNGILNCLSALRQEDPYMFNLCLNSPDIFTKEEISNNLKQNDMVLEDKKAYSNKELFSEFSFVYDDELDETENFKKLSDKLETNIQICNSKIVEEDLFIDRQNDKTTYFVKDENNNFMKVLRTTDNTSKIERPHRNIKPIVHANKEVQVLWKLTSDLDVSKNVFGGYIDVDVVVNKEENWFEMLNVTKNYMDTYNKRPSNSDKDNNIKKLGGWIQKQQTNYKTSKQSMKNKLIKNSWELFVNDLKYSKYFISNTAEWYNTLEKTKNYIDINNKRPSDRDKNEKIKKLGCWISTQQTNYKTSKQIMVNEEIKCIWKNFINEPKYSKYFISNIDEWYSTLAQTKNYIDKNNKLPSDYDKDIIIKKLGSWFQKQKTNYKTSNRIMANEEIKCIWKNFINDPKYSKYFISNTDEWYSTLAETKNYIDINNKRPSTIDKDIIIKKLGCWINNQKSNYKKSKYIMENELIKLAWKEFVTDSKYSQYFKDKPSAKSTTIKPKTIVSETDKEPSEMHKARKLSEYQELSKKMTIQKSETTKEMFKENESLWHDYHNYRDFSFKGYDNQDEIPLNKIIKYLETKKNHKLNILDLGCGRNLIQEYFKENKKFKITGYDYVSFNGSKVADISCLPEEDDSARLCVYSQSLMGYNWKEYLLEGYRVLEYNGEIIISESVERYHMIKGFLEEISMHIICEDYLETNRWFYIYAIKR